MKVQKRDGSFEERDVSKIKRAITWACEGLNASEDELVAEVELLLYDGISTASIQKAAITAAGSMIGAHPNRQDYKFVAARLLLLSLYKEVAGCNEYPHIGEYIHRGISEKRLNGLLASKFDLDALNDAIVSSRDLYFDYLGLQTLADRYFIRATAKGRVEGKIIELPQHFWMRVAMGLALKEDNPTLRAIEFYNVLSQLDYVSSTPTLFNSGTLHSQMSSCYLNTVADSISADVDEPQFASIFGTIEECARLSKYAGGIGTDWTPVRASGDFIHGTNGRSSGVIPYLKIYNDTAVAVNQGGKRKGSFAPYLEVWHPDALDFMDLKKATGEERQRAHDIFPAWWMCDLFMKRAATNGTWSFFSPKDYPELHELYGEEFEARYIQLESEGKFVAQIEANIFWRKMVSSLYETGHPWITFKDECNRRNPQSHVGVIHSSNLCTEITLNTSNTETAVCNLGSINLSRHLKEDADGNLVTDVEKLRKTTRVAMRMLDNVIDLNFYPSTRAKNSNLRHRPVGLGVMGETEWLVAQGIDWESVEHVEAVDELFEIISYYAIEASSDLASKRGRYGSYEGSKWSKGIFPIDTARDKKSRMDWEPLRQKVATQGMRNSNTMAVAPTATISNIAGTTPTIEPVLENQYVEGNLSGKFIVFDPSLKYGRPELCKEAFDIDPHWYIMCAAARQKWIDQSQSLNIYIPQGMKGSEIAAVYMKAWQVGLKTTYYCRTQSKRVKKAEPVLAKVEAPEPEVQEPQEEKTVFCTLEAMRNGGCEACT